MRMIEEMENEHVELGNYKSSSNNGAVAHGIDWANKANVKRRDLNLLSFGGEAKEDEEESVILNKKFTGKDKSAHDHLTDPKLSSQPAVEPPGLQIKKGRKAAVAIGKMTTK
ncbi:hypothetical protein WN48_02226 [Eufriesea mexicana]|uniref:Peptidyl-prolyl cis-trans isomerase CWC27 like protein n=1 Tax=Eufriesea mexicana TaxID=516756 RepID=A0A310SBI7_9HYME|nr:hypothetical protein WN48_02226 [Eufriesea mexicana]